jgi:hypothetical protein
MRGWGRVLPVTAGISALLIVAAYGSLVGIPARLRFARDSPLEGDGFEPSVPPRGNPTSSPVGTRSPEPPRGGDGPSPGTAAGRIRRPLRLLPSLYVLSGEVTFMIGDEVTVGGAGTCAFMPRGVPHDGRVPARKPRGCCFSTLRPRWAGCWRRATRTGHNFASMNEREVTEICQRGWEIVGLPPL